MATNVGTTTSTIGATPAPVVAVPLAKVSSPSATFSTAPNTSAIDQQLAITKAKVVVDAASGLVINEYINNTGAIVSQIPSQVVVAYLQAGLTAQGFGPETPASNAKPATNTNA
jgi:hypothetical protein